MSDHLIAKTVLKNKYWIVESEGSKVGTIQAVDDNSGFVYVHNNQREKFTSIKLLSKTHNVTFENTQKLKSKSHVSHEIYGFPVNSKPYNELWDVKHQFPIFTKTPKSKSFYCAGYYLIQFTSNWTSNYCPKMITLSRYPFKGPFKTKAEMLSALDETK